VRARHLKVLLVNCNTPMDNLIPAGVSLLAAVLKAEGCDVRCFDTTFYLPPDYVTGDEARAMTLQVKRTDFNELGIHPKERPITEDFRSEVEEFRPDLIGFSVIECTYRLGLELARAIVEYRPEVPRIWGNVHATFAAARIIDAPEIDILCVGEGEVPMRGLVRALADGRRPAAIPNLWIKNGAGVERNGLAPLVALDELPEQDWTIWERERFFKPMGGRIWVTGTFEMNRGCPYSCMYCVNYGLNRLYEQQGGYFREKSIPVLVREMLDKKRQYGLEFAYLVAESFLTTTRERLEQFAGLYPEVGLPFWVEARPESITRDKVRLLERCGCEGISIGVESGNHEFRKQFMNRNIPNEKMVRAMEILADSRLRVSANNVIGFPGETRDLIFETIELNRRFPRVNGVMCAIYNPYHGTRLREIAEERGYIDRDAVAGDYRKETIMRMEHLPPEAIKGLQRTFPLYVKFPKSRWPEIRRAEALTPAGDAVYATLADEYRERYP
jgi:anaerobic magnesium-protoporphyrin IX monomethyl ester cyclase